MFKTTGFRLWIEEGSLPGETVFGANASISKHIFTLFSAKTHLFGQIWTRVWNCLQHPHLPMERKTCPTDKLANLPFSSPSAHSPLSLLTGKTTLVLEVLFLNSKSIAYKKCWRSSGSLTQVRRILWAPCQRLLQQFLNKFKGRIPPSSEDCHCFSELLERSFPIDVNLDFYDSFLSVPSLSFGAKENKSFSLFHTIVFPT